MSEKLTRRTLASAILVPVALAGSAPPAAAQATDKRAEDPGELLTAAKESKRRAGADLAKFQVPMATEPAFVFKP